MAAPVLYRRGTTWYGLVYGHTTGRGAYSDAELQEGAERETRRVVDPGRIPRDAEEVLYINAPRAVRSNLYPY